MKKVKLMAILIAAIVMVGGTAGCSSLGDLSSILDDVHSAAAKDGEDYIDYVNADRQEVLDVYVGDKIGDDEATVLLDNVEFSYYEDEDNEGVYEVYVNNYNLNYFFDGIVRLESDDKTYKINVNMLAPDNYEYFNLEVEGNPDDYLYYVEGDMYEWKKDFLAPYTYEPYSTDNEYEALLVIAESEVSQEMVEEMALFLYQNDTIYNIDKPMTYLLVSEDNFDSSDSTIYDYELVVDTKAKTAVAEDADGESVLDTKF